MFAEADLLPISALQHLIFCERQCALIHNEQQWAENRLTVEGQQLHKKAHDAKRAEARPGIRIARGLPLRSLTLGLVGQADVVEFVEGSGGGDAVPLPVEYKRGRPKKHRADEVQLCAQAMCLEEMLDLPERIALGRLFYGQTRRRQDVPLDESLRRLTRDTVARLHDLTRSGHTPAAAYDKAKCDRCSLLQLCQPKLLRPRRTARSVFDRTLHEALGDPA